MLSIHFIVTGNLKESYLRDASQEYLKRLSGFCRPEVIELKEVRVPDSPSDKEILSALKEEGDRILSLLPSRAYKIALCVEGKQFTSEELAEKLAYAAQESGDFYFVIGSSHGLDERVKAACDLRLSVSKLTFPHQLMRVILLESVYRALNIQKGTRYHK
jgi:23S rRNA (pseudouridine1915-N3)-methyltransferase